MNTKQHRQERARMALEFIRKIATDNIIYIPTNEYFASALEWTPEQAETAIDDLFEFGAIKRVEPGVYELTRRRLPSALLAAPEGAKQPAGNRTGDDHE